MSALSVVIGIGNPMRSDDGVGHRVIDHLESLRPPIGADLVRLDGESARVLEAWRDKRLAVIVDAGHSGGEPGEIHRLEVGVDALPARLDSPSTHGAGLAAAIGLATALDALPDALVVFAVEAADFSMGEGLSAPVDAAATVVAERIAAELR